MQIAYLGRKSGTSLDRAGALERIGNTVDHIDLRSMLPASIWVDRIMHNLGGAWFSPWIENALSKRLQGRRYDLCWVDVGEFVTPQVIQRLRQHASRIVNYNIDDPLGPRDPAKSRIYRQSVPSYDLCVVMRPMNVAEAFACGARDVMRVWMTADERSHAPRVLTQKDREVWTAEVLFMGTWFPERGPFLSRLVDLGVPISIRGSNWFKAPEWKRLRPYWRGGPLKGDDYAKAIQCAKVNLGLLSKGNRDRHTTRSAEIPALGGLLCGERTDEHLAMYEEGSEALFWTDADECAAKCRLALSDDSLRESIARAGQVRVIVNGQFNEPAMASIVARASRRGAAVA